MMLRPSLLRSEFDSAVFLHFAGKSLQQLDAADRSGLFTTAQHNGDLDLVSAVQEAHHMALLDVEVMVVDLQTEANFLDFRGALIAAGLTSLDLLVVLVLAVIDELGDRRLRVGRHLDEIEVRFLCQVQCDGSRDAPTCSPFGPIRRTWETRISSLMRGSSLMMTQSSYSMQRNIL